MKLHHLVHLILANLMPVLVGLLSLVALLWPRKQVVRLFRASEAQGRILPFFTLVTVLWSGLALASNYSSGAGAGIALAAARHYLGGIAIGLLMAERILATKSGMAR